MLCIALWDFWARSCFPEAEVIFHLNLCRKDPALELTSEVLCRQPFVKGGCSVGFASPEGKRELFGGVTLMLLIGKARKRPDRRKSVCTYSILYILYKRREESDQHKFSPWIFGFFFLFTLLDLTGPQFSHISSSLFPAAVILHLCGKSKGFSWIPFKASSGIMELPHPVFVGHSFQVHWVSQLVQVRFLTEHHFKGGCVSKCTRKICHCLLRESRDVGHVRKAKRNWKEN